ncbi:MAG: TetR/AcrR family transcriptional regulator [Bacteroidia bacterium]|nr:TetR/AcrR family transcriptional regulator [Bacteroidia bacterium]
METKNRILQQAQVLFMRYGIRNVSMDDIAKELGISKKTIYQTFQDKAEIVHAVMEAHNLTEKCEMDSIQKNSGNALEELVGVLQYIAKTLKMASPLLIYEIKKYYPESWQYFRKAEDEYHLPQIRRNLKQGVEEGLFRAEIKVEEIARFRLGMLEVMLDTRLFPHDSFNQNEVMIEISRFYIHGLLTDKGREVLSGLNIKF